MNNYGKNRSILRLVMLFVLSLAMAWTMIPGLIGSTVYAAAGNVPDHSKTLIKNDDGTYTIALSVTGDAEKVTQPVKTNVIVILDTSGSMDEGTGNTEVTYTPSDQNDRNMYGTNDGGQTYFRIYRRGWWPDYYYTTTPDGQTRYNGTRYLRQEANQTRLEAAQSAINNLAGTLLSKNGQDGNPDDLIQMALVTFANGSNTARTPTTSQTQFETAVNNTNANGGTNWEAGLRTANNIDFGDDDQTFVIFVSDGNPTFYINDSTGNRGGTGYETEDNINTSYNQAVPAAVALANKVTPNNFFTIGAYGNVDRMESLTTAAGAPGENYFSAENTAALQEALAAILEKIEMAGIAEVDISDGTTDQVSVGSSTANLLNVDTSSFKYYRAGGTADAGGEKYDSSQNNGLGEEWADAPDATYENSTVDWDLSTVGVLENGVTYTVTFDCWPSQDTLDYLADIENGLYDTLPEAAKKYIDKDGNLATNTTASLSYKDTRTGENNESTYDNPDPVTSSAVEQLAVAKEWQNAVDSQQTAPITLDVTRDGTHKYDLSLSSANQWKGSVYVSIGIMRTGENNEMEILTPGHDFTFVEPEAVGYRWELDIPTVHPMLIDGELTMLIKVDEEHQPGSAKTYTINGSQYYVGSTGEANLTATNYRRSQLVLTKAVEGEDAPADTKFPFTMTVNNSKAEEGEAGNYDSDYYVWFLIADEAGETVKEQGYVTSGATAEMTGGAFTGYYYAESGAAISAQIPADYSIRFINLPKGSDYRFDEGTLPTGFKFKTADLTKGTDTSFVVGDKYARGTVVDWNSEYETTFTNEYVLTDVTVTKSWVDGSDQDGIRPDNLTLTLNGLPRGETAPTPSITKSGNTWTYKWEGVPKYDTTGRELTYTVTEGTVPEGYEVSGSPAAAGGTITNTHTPEVTEVEVTKSWVDGSDQDGIRPDNLTLTLNGLPSGTTAPTPQITKSGNTWTYKWTGLPKYADGEEIAYTVSENSVPSGYNVSGSPAAAGGTITNTHTTATTEVEVTKSWVDGSDQDGIRPDNLTLTLNGLPSETTAPTPQITKSGNTWTYKWTGLPKYAAGEEITYTVSEETVPTGYEVSGSPAAAGGTITNTHTPAVVDISATKKWDDENDKDGIRPDSLELTLNAPQGVTIPTPSIAKDGNTWTYTWKGMPEKSAGAAIEYTVSEKTVPEGYKVIGKSTVDAGGTITNKHTSVNAQIAGLKVLENYSGNIPTGKFFFTITGKSFVPENEAANSGDAADQSAQTDANNSTSDSASAPGTDAAVEKAEAKSEEAQKAADEAAATAEKAQTTADEAAAKGSEDAAELQKAADDAKAAAEDAQNVADEAAATAEEVQKSSEEGQKAEEAKSTDDSKAETDEIKADSKGTAEEAKAADSTEIPLPEKTKVTNTAEGTIAFGDIKFTEPGKYTYEITESGSMDNVTNDSETTKEVVVTVTADADGNLKATVEPSGTYQFKFTNTYEPPHDPGVVSIDPPVKKIVEGDAPKKAETYTFLLRAADPSNPMPKAAGGSQTMYMDITGAGEKEFGKIEFTEEGIYDYTINEVAGTNSNCEYDGTVYTVRATVTADADGKLQVNREYFKDGEAVDVATFEFVNTYVSESGGVKTGDDNSLAGWLTLMLLAGSGFGCVGYSRRRREN